MSDEIIIKDLSYSYRGSPALANISLEIPSSTITFLMGNNGSGKTTLLKCITNVLSDYTGSISINGRITKTLSPSQMAKLISYVPQVVNASHDFLAKDFLVLGRLPYVNTGSPSKDDYHIVEKYASITGITPFLEKNYNHLSGGQKQWISITRALIQETPILVMDEPMSALDLQKQADLLKLLSWLCDSLQKTIILTSHNPNHPTYINSLVFLLYEHTIVAGGKAKDVFQEELIQKVYGENVVIRPDGFIDINITQ